MPHVLWEKTENPSMKAHCVLGIIEVFAVFPREDYNWPDSE
jgi:hypothetical protein